MAILHVHHMLLSALEAFFSETANLAAETSHEAPSMLPCSYYVKSC